MADKHEDGFYNAVIGHGQKMNLPGKGMGGGMPMTEERADNLYTYNGIARKIIQSPAHEAVRAGFYLTDGVTVLEQDRAIQSALEDINAGEILSYALAYSRLFGGAGVLILADDGRSLEEPMNEDGIKAIERLELFEPIEIQPEENTIFNDPTNPNYGKPEYYQLTGYYGGLFRVHESRLMILRGEQVSNRVRRQRNGWGGKVFERMESDLAQYSGALQLGIMAMSRLSQGVLQLQDMSNLLQSDFGETQVQKRLQLIDMARHLMNTIAIDKEDEYKQENISLAGIKDIIETFQVQISAVSDIPATVLFGRSPAGQNATGHSDFENYYNMISRIQKQDLRPMLSRLVDLLGKAKVANLPQEYTIEFNPLWSLSDKEQADTDKVTADANKAKADTAKIYADMGVLDISEVRETLKGTQDYAIDDSMDKALEEARNGNSEQEAASISDND